MKLGLVGMAGMAARSRAGRRIGAVLQGRERRGEMPGERTKARQYMYT